MKPDEDPIRLCVRGEISPEVAIARLLLLGWTAERYVAKLSEYQGSKQTEAIERVWQRCADIPRLRSLLELADHGQSFADEDQAIASVARIFDRAVAIAPEASVALYSLGDRATFERATDETVSWIESKGLLLPEDAVLDLGCGIGRIAGALAPKVRCVLGVDISAAMVAEARRRYRAVSNLRFQRVGGRNLAELRGKRFGLVIAIDSFPYLIQAGAGLAERHVGDIAGLLTETGRLVICNLSYGRSLERDRQDVATWCERYGFTLDDGCATPFTLWDGTAFAMRRRVATAQAAER